MVKIYCPNCGAENSQGDNYCGECGSVISSISPSVAQRQIEITPDALSQNEASLDEKPVMVKKAILVIKSGGQPGRRFDINQDVVNIGRWDAESGIFPEIDLTEDDPGHYVSRKHARVFLKGNEYFIEDMGSANGTYLNKGSRLVPGAPQRLHNEDEVIIGRTFFTFVVV